MEIVIYEILPITECRFLNDYILNARKKKTGIPGIEIRFLDVMSEDMHGVELGR